MFQEPTVEQRRGWAVEKVIAMAGIPDSEITNEIVALARRALRQNYYLDQAALWLVDVLRGPRR